MPGRHPELHLADRAHRLARLLDEPLHLRGRSAGSLGVRVAGEENQQSVAAKLEDVASSPIRDPDQAFENAADRQHQLLGARSSLRLKPLGESRESGEIDRDERARRARARARPACVLPSRARAAADMARGVRRAARPFPGRGYAFGPQIERKGGPLKLIEKGLTSCRVVVSQELPADRRELPRSDRRVGAPRSRAGAPRATGRLPGGDRNHHAHHRRGHRRGRMDGHAFVLTSRSKDAR